MYPAPIEQYSRPSTLEELYSLLDSNEEDILVLAGGQSAMQAVKSRMLRPAHIIDLQALSELKFVTSEKGLLTVGAMTRYVDIVSSDSIPLELIALKDAASRVGDRQVRNRGTIGGSLCWNYSAACTPATVLALDGAMNLISPDGSTRQVAADDFFLGPLETVRNEFEILLSVDFKLRGSKSGSAYKKWGLVTDALPVIGIAACLHFDNTDCCDYARITLTGLSGAQRCLEAEASLLSTTANTEEITEAMMIVCSKVSTYTDSMATADYRYQLIKTIGLEVIEIAKKRAFSLG
jgi:carbon-monoxide dehydrogenase medium subunit